MAHRVLIADNLPDTARTRLQAAGLEVIADASLKDDALTAALKAHKPDALVVRSTKVRAEQLAAAASLQLVVRAGAGVNTIDMTAASARGIYVCNCPGTNSVAVAELTFGLLVSPLVADSVLTLDVTKALGVRAVAVAANVRARLAEKSARIASAVSGST